MINARQIYYNLLYNTLGFKNVHKPCPKMWLSEHNVIYKFCKA